MTTSNRMRGLSLALAVFSLLSAGVSLSACNAVAGAGQDVSAVGNSVTNGAESTQRSTRAP